jgi:hypothetical protein
VGAADLPRRKPLNQGYVLKVMEQFAEAIKWDHLPHQAFRACGTDYENDCIVITIYPDDPYFRKSVAALLPEGSFRFEVEDVRGSAV